MNFLKFVTKGNPHFRKFRLSDDNCHLCWNSTFKRRKHTQGIFACCDYGFVLEHVLRTIVDCLVAVRLASVNSVISGQGSDTV